MKRILTLAAMLFCVTAASAEPANQPKKPAQARAEASQASQVYVPVTHPYREHRSDPTAAPFNADGCKGTVPFPACTGGN